MIPVIIPAYKAEFRLPKCLAAVRSQDVETEIFIRDNSLDNIYYTGGVNEGLLKYLAQPEVKYSLILSDDVVLRPNCLSRLRAVAESNLRAGIIVPTQIGRDGRVIWCGSLNSWPSGKHIISRPSSEPFKTPWASGAVMLVRMDMVREIGLMDKNFRLICQDSDWSLTARSRGWECWVEPGAEVEHEFCVSHDVTPEISRLKLEEIRYFTGKWLSGDLFRTLEYDGDKISPEDPVDILRQIEVELGKIKCG